MRMRNDGGSFYNRDVTNCPEAAGPFVTQQDGKGEAKQKRKAGKAGND